MPYSMKKITLFSALLLILSLAAFKNLHAQEGIKIGFRASPLIGWATTVDDSTKTKPDGLTNKAGLGFSFDFVLTYGLTESVAFRTGINIASKSAKSEVNSVVEILGTTTTTNLTSRVNFTAVEIPLGLKFRSPEIGTGLYVVGHFGVNAEINLQNRIFNEGSTVVEGGGTTISTTIDEEFVDVDGIRPFTASFVPGVGVDWEFDWGMVEMGLTYHWGLLSFTDPDKFGGQRSRLNYLALNLGYFF